MSGIMFGALLDGLGRGASSLGQSAAQAQQYEAESRRRMEERELDAELRRDLASQRGAGAGGRRSGGAGGAALDMAEGSLQEESTAARMGMSLPEFRQWRQAERSGDFAGYEEEYQKPTDAPGADGMGPVRDPQTAKGVTPARKDWIAQKRATFSKIADEFSFGGDYKNVTEGRRNDRELGIMNDTLAGKLPPERVAETMGAMKGEGAYKGGESVATNQYTGKQSLNALGAAKVAGEYADAKASNARASRDSAGSKDDRIKVLEQQRLGASNELNSAQTALRNFDAAAKDLGSKDREARKPERAALVEAVNLARDQLSGVNKRLATFGEEKGVKDAQDKPRSEPKPAPGKNGSTLPALPAGAVRVGTSGGKPVYEAVINGEKKRFIQG